MSVMSASAAIAIGVRALWKEGHLHDFTIHVADHSFKVHKLIMCSVSDYFRAMLTGGMAESTADSVQLEGMDAAVIETLINFIYTDKMNITIPNATDTLAGAMYLQIQTAIDVCIDFLHANLDAKNCFAVLSLLEEYSLVGGADNVKNFIKKHFQEVVKEIDTSNLKCEHFCYLMAIWPDSEMLLFQFVKNWVEAEPEKRKGDVNRLLSGVRFCLMTPQELEEIKAMNLYTSSNGPWKDLIDKALQYHQLPIHMKVLDSTEQSRVRSPMAPSYFAEIDAHAGIYTLDSESHEWRTYPLNDTHIPIDCLFSETVIAVNNFLVVKASHVFLGEWYIFDPRQLSWSQIADMGVNREDVAKVYHSGYLYVIGGVADDSIGGGLSDVIEKYDFQSNTWSPFVSLPKPRFQHDACLYKNSIFVMGGTNNFSDTLLSDVDCLNLNTQQWDQKAPMLQPCKHNMTCVMTLHGEEVLCSFTKDFNLSYYRMDTNQWSTFNYAFASKLPPPSWYNVIMQGNTITFADDYQASKWYNKGECFQLVYPQHDDKVSVHFLEHFHQEGDADSDDDEDKTLGFYGAGLSVPLYKFHPVTSKE